MHRTNWDDLRFVLAVAEEGSVSAASRRLGVNHATVLRRIAAFEDQHGASIFDRDMRGYVVRPDKLRVIEAARTAGLAMEQVQRLVRGNALQPVERICITSTDTFCQVVLPPLLALVAEGFKPQFEVELTSANHHLDLARLRADITVRPAFELPDDLTGVPAGELGFAAYVRAGAPQPETWLGLSGAIARSRAAAWMADEIDATSIRGAADSFPVLRELAAEGAGIGILPCCLGDRDARLIRLADAMPRMTVPIWVASHVELAPVPRLEKLRARLAEVLIGVGPWLKGLDQ
ncbi:MAG: LysR family transcriptional regulator [Flavimaricola sp.]|nr:LysR family transcriptional regulator [Flavimaricola sp.]